MAYFLACERGYQGSLLHWIEVETYKYGRGFVHWDTFIDTTGYGSEVKRKALEIHSCQVPTAKFLDLEDEIYGKECGCESAETFIACRLNADHPGELTQEFLQHSRT
jgi:hypothetical protein